MDVIKGAVNAVVDNASSGTLNKRNCTSYTDADDYNLGQDIGDGVSAAIAFVEIIQGAVETGGGVVVAVGSGGTLSVPGAELSTKGVVTISHGGLTLANAIDNFSSQKGRIGNSDKKGPKNLVEEAKQLKEQKTKANERQAKRDGLTQRGNSRTGKSNQNLKGEHNSGGNNPNKHHKGNTRRAKDQGVKGPDDTK